MRASSRKSGRSRRTALGKLLDEPQSSKAATMIFIVIILAILTSVATFYLTSVPSLTAPDGGFALHTAEAVRRSTQCSRGAHALSWWPLSPDCPLTGLSSVANAASPLTSPHDCP